MSWAATGVAFGQTVQILYAFSGTDGAIPLDGLVLADDGNFYGTTYYGGDGGNGNVFRISPEGVYTNLHSFQDTPDGSYPVSGLTRGRDGYLYGTCALGGVFGGGTVFRLSLTGDYTNLYSFNAPPDGSTPYCRLVLGEDGFIYGTTEYGGAYTDTGGTFFRIGSSGDYTNLFSFGSSTNDGNRPNSLMQANDGYFYGMTLIGGTSNLGTIFRINRNGSNYSILHSFGTITNDGEWPYPATLVPGPDGFLYGCVANGGINYYGTIFRLSTNGVYTNLYLFTDLATGASPNGGLILGSDGNLYGSCGGGITNNRPGRGGIIYRLSPAGVYSNLYAFKGAPDGDGSYQLVQGLDGDFYGTTQAGGNGAGTVFKFSMPLNPPANQITALRLNGSSVNVSVSSIAGASYQLQQRDSLTSGTWTNVPGASVINSIGATITVTNFAGAADPQQFFRFAVTP